MICLTGKNKTEKPLHKKLGAEKAKIGKYFLDLPYMELTGNQEVKIEGCKGVLSYDEDCVRVNTPGIIICLKGRSLCLKSLSPTCLVIEGFITSLEFDV